MKMILIQHQCYGLVSHYARWYGFRLIKTNLSKFGIRAVNYPNSRKFSKIVQKVKNG